MDVSAPHDYATPDYAYNPQVINEQDPATVNHEDHSKEHVQTNGHSQAAAGSPALESESGSRYNSPNLAYQQQPSPRPNSGLNGQHQQYQAQYQAQYQDHSRQQQPASKSSVVIKVGMVGDAQIGKTSLMVKYVEGSWDEDYIQTLGMRRSLFP